MKRRLRPLAQAVLGTLAVSVFAPAPAATHGRAHVAHCGLQQWQPYIARAAQRFGVRERWLRAIVLVESSGCASRAGRPIRSGAGAMGLMQIQPITWRRFSHALNLKRGASDPLENILVGAAYLRELHRRFGASGFLAAYNAGPERYKQYLWQGRPLPRATLIYLARLRRVLGPRAGPLLEPEPSLARVLIAQAPSWGQGAALEAEERGPLGREDRAAFSLLPAGLDPGGERSE